MDPELVVDEDIKQRLMDGGMDDLLATHFAHLFIRDPIVIFGEDLQELDLSKTDHFENLQSTNWQHMRFKPPPPDNSIGWRVEFRPMEIQITDFENAAFSVFIVLVTRAILSFDLNFYIPIPRTDRGSIRAPGTNDCCRWDESKSVIASIERILSHVTMQLSVKGLGDGPSVESFYGSSRLSPTKSPGS